MSIFSRLASVFRVLAFERPRRNDVLIFDENGSDIIVSAVLPGIAYSILPARFERIHVHPAVLWHMITGIRRLRISDMPPGWLVDPRMLALQLRHLYFLAAIAAIDPKVVLTTVDTHFFFQRCSRTYPGATFIAIINGFRDLQALEPPFLPAPPHPASKTSMPHLYCCGEADIDIYREMNQDVDHMYPVGTIRGGAYLERRRRSPPTPTYEIAIVSQWRRNMFGDEWRPELRRGYALKTMMQFTGRYLKETGASACVAMVQTDGRIFEEEGAFCREHLGDLAELIPNNRDDRLSYSIVDKGKIVLSAWSTLGVEAFGWGKRTLMCNFKGDPRGYLPRLGLWSLTEPDYEKFKARVDRIRAMTDEEYRRECGEAAHYMMAYDMDNLPHVAIRRHVLACLGRSEETAKAAE